MAPPDKKQLVYKTEAACPRWHRFKPFLCRLIFANPHVQTLAIKRSVLTMYKSYSSLALRTSKFFEYGGQTKKYVRVNF